MLNTSEVRMHLIESGPAWDAFNREPFMFRHQLANHPLFELSRLSKLVMKIAERGDSQKYYLAGGKFSPDMSVKERLMRALSQIEEDSFWLKLSSLNEDRPGLP